MSAISRITRRSSLMFIVAIVAAVALVPAAASAATTTFGSSLNHSPANSGSTCEENGAGPSTVCTHVGSYYPGTSGHARSPVNGKITALKLRPQGPMTFTAKVVNVRNVSSDHKSGQAQAVNKSRQISVNGNGGVVTVDVSLKVRKNQEIAIDTASNTAEYCTDGTPGQLLFDPPLAVGQGFSNSDSVDGCLMLVQAVVKH
jgi:hypothetical protein